MTQQTKADDSVFALRQLPAVDGFVPEALKT